MLNAAQLVEFWPISHPECRAITQQRIQYGYGGTDKRIAQGDPGEHASM